MTTRIPKTLIFAWLLGMTTVAAVHARDVTLQWDPNTEPALAGYKIYYKADAPGPPFTGTESAQGASPVNAGNQTTATLTGLDPARSYYFAVTAYDAGGSESAYSNTVYVLETIAPTASITAPAANSAVAGTTTVSVTAGDNLDVAKVEYFVDGTMAGSDTASPYSFIWNTSLLSSGPHTLLAKAYDAAGNVGESAAVTVTVANDTTPPTAAIASPANGSTLSGTATVSITAADNIGTAKVELYLNGTLFATYGSAPYDVSWNTIAQANGPFILTARAYDAAGNVGQSSAVTVTVNNQVAGATPPTLKGDLDGDSDITIADVLIMLKAVMNPSLQTAGLKETGDVSPLNAAGKPAGDGRLDIADALIMLRRSIGVITW